LCIVTRGNEYVIGNQIWSDPVRAENCQKTTFRGNEGTVRDFNADCCDNPGYAGNFFSWCAVARFAEWLCPYPWRVPTLKDFEILNRTIRRGKLRVDKDFPQIIEKYKNEFGGEWTGQASPNGRILVRTYIGDSIKGNSFYWSQSQPSFRANVGFAFSIISVYDLGTDNMEYFIAKNKFLIVSYLDNFIYILVFFYHYGSISLCFPCNSL